VENGRFCYAFLGSNPDSSLVLLTILAVACTLPLLNSPDTKRVSCPAHYLILVFYEGMTRERWRKCQEDWSVLGRVVSKIALPPAKKAKMKFGYKKSWMRDECASTERPASELQGDS
jgi:hypothetical protein